MKELTEKYIAFFDSKDLEGTMQMFHDDAVLKDTTNTFKRKKEISKLEIVAMNE